jgi:hypothetical protein
MIDKGSFGQAFAAIKLQDEFGQFIFEKRVMKFVPKDKAKSAIDEQAMSNAIHQVKPCPYIIQTKRFDVSDGILLDMPLYVDGRGRAAT